MAAVTLKQSAYENQRSSCGKIFAKRLNLNHKNKKKVSSGKMHTPA